MPCAVLFGEFLLSHPMLFCVGSFSYMPHVMLCWEFLLHTTCYFKWKFSLTHCMLFHVGTFSYAPHAFLCGEFLLHTPCYVMWGVSLICHMLLYVSSLVFFTCGICLTDPMLFYVGYFSYSPHAMQCGEIFLYATCCFMWEFRLQTPCYVMWGVSLTHPMLF